MSKRFAICALLLVGCGDQDLGVLFGRNPTASPEIAPEPDWNEIEEVLRDGERSAEGQPPSVGLVGPDLSDLPAPRFAGLVHGPDGMLYAVPARARRFLRIDPMVPNTAELFGPELPDGEWGGAALGGDGVIYLAPLDQARVFAFDPSDPAAAGFVGPDFSDLPNSKWRGFVPGLDGRLFAIPSNAGAVLAFNPQNPMESALLGSFPSGLLFDGGVLAPSGAIYGVPAGSERILLISPAENSATLLGPTIGPGPDKYSAGTLNVDGIPLAFGQQSGSVLLINPGENPGVQQLGGLDGGKPHFVRSAKIAGDGRVYGVPAGSPQAIRIDANRPGELQPIGPIFDGALKWRGLILTTTGQLIAAPYNEVRLLTITPSSDSIPSSVVLSPFLNYY